MNNKELKKILESNQNTILYFYNTSCGHCKQLTPKIKLFENKSNSNFYSINTFKHESISKIFKIDWVPVLMVIKEGKLETFDGLKEIEKFLL